MEEEEEEGVAVGGSSPELAGVRRSSPEYYVVEGEEVAVSPV